MAKLKQILMYWKQYDENDVPMEEVLAKDRHENLLVGYIKPGAICESSELIMGNVTHYILVSDLVKLHNELKP